MMVFRKEGGWKVSGCGNYKIQAVGWKEGRSSWFRLRVHLDDGWIDYPETFRLLRDAKAAAAHIEET